MSPASGLLEAGLRGIPFALLFVLLGSRLPRGAGRGLWGILLLAFWVDGVHLGVTHRHLAWGPFREASLDLASLLDSLRAELTLREALALGLGLGLFGWAPSPLERSQFKRSEWTWLLLVSGLGIAGVLLGRPSSPRSQGPLEAWSRSLGESLRPRSFPPRLPEAEFRSRRSTSHAQPRAQALSLFLQRIRSRTRPPNLIYLMIESAGRWNLLDPQGNFLADRMPRLARRLHGSSSLVFSGLISPFPGTTRCHVPLLTGGVSFTSAPVEEALERPFAGDTLPRALLRAGYQNLVFTSSYDFQGLGRFYQTQPFHRSNLPLRPGGPRARSHALNSWGVQERVLAEEVETWLRGGPPQEPFFLMLQNQATHHPYPSPPELRPDPPLAEPDPGGGRFQAGDPLTRYRRALRASDLAFDRALEALAARGLLENSLLVVSGDHGEAFGGSHPENWIHREHLYEENLRNFLWIADLSQDSGERLWDPRPANLGVITPTLLELVGADFEGPGTSLFAVDSSPTLCFAYKFAPPAELAVWDGEQKFRMQLGRPSRMTRVDLRGDPWEEHPREVSAQDLDFEMFALAHEWFRRSQETWDRSKVPPGGRRSPPKKVADGLRWVPEAKGIPWPPGLDQGKSTVVVLTLERGGTRKAFFPAGISGTFDLAAWGELPSGRHRFRIFQEREARAQGEVWISSSGSTSG